MVIKHARKLLSARRKRSISRRSTTRRTMRHRRKGCMRGGNYRDVTYAGFPKNKNALRMYFPGGSATYGEYKAEVADGDTPYSMK